MNLKFKKLNAKLVYRLYDFNACLLGDYPGESLRSSIFLKSGFEHFIKNTILKIKLSGLFREWLLIGEDFPKLFMKGELNQLNGFDYLEMYFKLEDEGLIKEVEVIDKLNLWVVYKDQIKEGLIIDQDEFLKIKGAKNEK